MTQFNVLPNYKSVEGALKSFVSPSEVADFMRNLPSKGKEKSDGYTFLPGMFESGSRSLEALIGFDVCLVDVDHATQDQLNQAKIILKSLAISSVLWTSYSHTDESPRFKILFFLSKGYKTAHAYHQIANLAAQRLGLEIDPKSAAPCQCNDFHPVMGNGKKAEIFYFQESNGIFIDKMANISDSITQPEGSESKAPSSYTRRSNSEYSGKKMKVEEIIEAVRSLSSGNRHTSFMELGTKCVFAAWSDTQLTKKGFLKSLLSVDTEWVSELCVAYRSTGKDGKEVARDWRDVARKFQNGTIKLSRSIKTTDDNGEDGGVVFINHDKAFADWEESQTILPKAKVVVKNFNHNLDNYTKIFSGHPEFKGRFKYNDFREVVDVDGCEIKEEIYSECERFLDSRLGKAKSELVQRAVITSAFDNRHNPIVDGLKALKWDGVDRISSFLQKYLRAEDTAIAKKMFKKWLVSACARAINPGVKADSMLVLMGGQGVGKTSLFEALAMNPQYFCSLSSNDLTSKDPREKIDGMWIIEMPELSSIERNTLEATKAFLSERADRYRKSYRRDAGTYYRKCVLGGTGNKPFIRDRENRRFWCVECGDHSPEHWESIRGEMMENIPQLWAEAMHYFNQGEQWWFSSSEDRREVEIAAERFRVESVWQIYLSEYLEGKDSVSFTAMSELLKDKGERFSCNQVADYISAKGFIKLRNKNQNTWVRKGSAADPAVNKDNSPEDPTPTPPPSTPLPPPPPPSEPVPPTPSPSSPAPTTTPKAPVQDFSHVQEHDLHPDWVPVKGASQELIQSSDLAICLEGASWVCKNKPEEILHLLHMWVIMHRANTEEGLQLAIKSLEQPISELLENRFISKQDSLKIADFFNEKRVKIAAQAEAAKIKVEVKPTEMPPSFSDCSESLKKTGKFLSPVESWLNQKKGVKFTIAQLNELYGLIFLGSDLDPAVALQYWVKKGLPLAFAEKKMENK